MNRLSDEQLKDLYKMRKEREKNPHNLKFKVSKKGAVSIYGVGRFPVTYYINQWEKILHIIPLLEEFIKENQKECDNIIAFGEDIAQ